MEELGQALDSRTSNASMRITPTAESGFAHDVVIGNIKTSDITYTVVNIDDLTVVTADVVEPEDLVAIEHLEVDAEASQGVGVFWSAHAVVTLTILVVVGHHTDVTATLSGLHKMIHDQGADAVVGEDEVLDPDAALGVVDVVDQSFELVVTIGVEGHTGGGICDETLPSQVAHECAVCTLCGEGADNTKEDQNEAGYGSLNGCQDTYSMKMISII